MRASFCIAAVLAPALSAVGLAQSAAVKPVSPVRLDLTIEVATTSDDGNPSALLVTVKNVGRVTATMPVLGDGCSPDNGIKLHTTWSAVDGRRGTGGNASCGMFDGPPLWQRVKMHWIQLRASDYMTATLRLTLPNDEPGTVEYWVEYTPPSATPNELDHFDRAANVIPTEKLETEHRSFEVH